MPQDIFIVKLMTGILEKKEILHSTEKERIEEYLYEHKGSTYEKALEDILFMITDKED